jgi:hypothetical protein
MAKGGLRSLNNADKVALRLLAAQFFISCERLSPCWYRINSRDNNYLSCGNIKAPLPSISDLFGISDERANDIILACGLMKLHGNKLNIDKKGWDALKSEHSLDIEVDKVSNGQLIGKKVYLVRVGGFGDKDPFDAATLAKNINNKNTKTHKLPRMRFTAERTAFCMNVAVHMPIKEDDSDSETEDASAGVAPPAAVTPVVKKSMQINFEDKDTPATVKGANGVEMTWVRVPNISNLKSSKKQFQRSNFIPNLLQAISKNGNEEEAAFWLFMSMGKKHPKALEMSAQSLGYIPLGLFHRPVERMRLPIYSETCHLMKKHHF